MHVRAWRGWLSRICIPIERSFRTIEGNTVSIGGRSALELVLQLLHQFPFGGVYWFAMAYNDCVDEYGSQIGLRRGVPVCAPIDAECTLTQWKQMCA